MGKTLIKGIYQCISSFSTGIKNNRTPKNLYVLNLGVSGLATCLICIPPTLIQCLYGGKWYFGLIACKLVPTVQGTNILVSTGNVILPQKGQMLKTIHCFIPGTITAIAVDRWVSITSSHGGSPQVSNGGITVLQHCTVLHCSWSSNETEIFLREKTRKSSCQWNLKVQSGIQPFC